MRHIVNMLGRSAGKKASLLVLSAAALAAVGTTPSPAYAGHEKGRVDFDINLRIGDRDRDRYDDRRVRVWVPAEYRTVCDRRFVEPVYQDRCERAWVEPVYEVRRDRVWIDEVVEVREVRRYDRHCGRWAYARERVVVCPGRWEYRERRVCVRDGRFEESRNRVCVSEGRWENVDRQELVRDGHWAWRTEHVAGGRF